MVYFKLFNDCLQAGADPEYVERLAHLIMVAGTMKGATTKAGLMPLIERLPTGGEEMANEMSKLVRPSEIYPLSFSCVLGKLFLLRSNGTFHPYFLMRYLLSFLPQNQTMEQTLKKIVKTKKHPENKEFIQLMQEFQSQGEEASQLELKALTELVKNVDEEELIQAALTFEQAKMDATMSF